MWSARGAGSAGRAAAARVHADMAGTAAVPLLMAAAAVVAGDLGLGACGLVVGGNVPVALVVAVAAAHGVGLAGVADLNVVQTAAAGLVVAAIILCAIQIRHTKHLRP